tara:strand:+ start:1062 stop:1460 length:399 start_codon:yes stop_codon:yes gene_type:complete
MTKEISDALNLDDIDNVKTELYDASSKLKQSTNSSADDFQYARENLYGIIERGQDALNGIVELAQQSQHPRTYEVAAILVRALSDANKDLLELQKRKKDLDGIKGPKTINNNLFVGSTNDLQKLIKKTVSDE